MKRYITLISTVFLLMISNNIFAQDNDYTQYEMSFYHNYVNQKLEKQNFYMLGEDTVKLGNSNNHFSSEMNDWYDYVFVLIGTDSFPNVGGIHLVPADGKSRIENDGREDDPFLFAIYYPFHPSQRNTFTFYVKSDNDNSTKSDSKVLVRLYRRERPIYQMHYFVAYNNLFPALGLGAFLGVEKKHKNPIAPFGAFVKITWSPMEDGDPDAFSTLKTGNTKRSSWASTVCGLMLETDFGEIYAGLGYGAYQEGIEYKGTGDNSLYGGYYGKRWDWDYVEGVCIEAGALFRFSEKYFAGAGLHTISFQTIEISASIGIIIPEEYHL